MNNNTQIETVEDAKIEILNKYGITQLDQLVNVHHTKELMGLMASWQKQQDEAKYKELLDSHNELLELLRNARPLMQPREYCKGDDYLILNGRIENAINKAKNIKL